MTDTSSTPGDTRPLALVTGASSGIGRELARLFARDGHDLVVVAESDGLDVVATELSATGVSVTPVTADLATPDGVARVADALRAQGRPLVAAALNAGIGRGGAFTEVPLDDSLAVVDLNVRSTVHLAKVVLDGMIRAGEGRVLITSSVASTMPGPYQAVYNASKSFLQSFAEGIQGELSESPVTVTSLMPGPVETNFFHRARMDDTAMGRSRKDDPADVARAGYDAMQAGSRRVVAASVMSKAMAAVDAVLPDVVKATGHKVLAKPREVLRR
ncbi:SDR family NAD(P)-dependent oxidoreductase [Rhodococcus sp. BP-316]|uniref:SDR family NAD(P)-dependent oxidoreductase n=1 Tax=Rhodococcus sp. BP-316 TaxID=2739445 RepID=UPI001C9A30F9|nr:SDR family NAD(P)-dependent oxidoreductase [Rhodococcus sp. BP-316]MBY6680863.1 SDR family NAD(P)-dependent oxidoreductase [Rhodococcus sp. BP-316]